jgi:hypothetical protein
MSKYREIELKFASKGSYAETCMFLKELLGEPYQDGSSNDWYWEAPECDFVRLRQNSTPTKAVTLTTKTTDKGSSLDRREVNVEIPEDQVHEARALLKTCLGDPALLFRQQYTLYRADPDTVVSAYTISKSKEVFIEVESKNITTVKKWAQYIDMVLDRQIPKSLWDMYKAEELLV